jgi:hypothetical protein
VRWFGLLALTFCVTGACKRDVAAVLSLDITGPDAAASTRAIVVALAGLGGGEATLTFDHDGDLISLHRPQRLSITFREGQTGAGRATVTACDDRRQRMLAGSVDVAVSDGKAAAFAVELVLQPQSCAAGGPDGGTCTTKTCAALEATCGMVPDGCDGVLSCGDCTAPESCGGGGRANTCGVGTCIPVTCEVAGATCGLLGDGCGHVLECGGCTAPLTCGGGGRTNQCGCTPTTCVLRGADCGRLEDGCGGTLECGTCAAPRTCMGGGVPNVCGGEGGAGGAGAGGAGGAGAGGAGGDGGAGAGGGGMTCGDLGMECCASNQCNGSLACVLDAGALGYRCRDCGGIGLACCENLFCEGGDCISGTCMPSTSNCDPRPATSASSCPADYACYYANPDTRCVPLGPSSPAGTACCTTGNMMSCFSNFCAPGYRCSSYQNGSCTQVCRLGDATCPAPMACVASTTIAAPYGLCQ